MRKTIPKLQVASIIVMFTCMCMGMYANAIAHKMFSELADQLTTEFSEPSRSIDGLVSDLGNMASTLHRISRISSIEGVAHWVFLLGIVAFAFSIVVKPPVDTDEPASWRPIMIYIMAGVLIIVLVVQEFGRHATQVLNAKLASDFNMAKMAVQRKAMEALQNDPRLGRAMSDGMLQERVQAENKALTEALLRTRAELQKLKTSQAADQ